MSKEIKREKKTPIVLVIMQRASNAFLWVIHCSGYWLDEWGMGLHLSHSLLSRDSSCILRIPFAASAREPKDPCESWFSHSNECPFTFDYSGLCAVSLCLSLSPAVCTKGKWVSDWWLVRCISFHLRSLSFFSLLFAQEERRFFPLPLPY